MNTKLVRPLQGPRVDIRISGLAYSVETDPKMPADVVELRGSDRCGIRYNTTTGELTLLEAR